MQQEELNKILRDHKPWLDTGFSGSTQGKRVDLRFEDLRFADLTEADLRNTNLGFATEEECNNRQIKKLIKILKGSYKYGKVL